VAQEQLHGVQVLRAPVDQCCLRSPHRMHPVVCWFKAKLLDPTFEDSSVLTCSQVRVVNAARE
jgi:hypothetical protein